MRPSNFFWNWSGRNRWMPKPPLKRCCAPCRQRKLPCAFSGWSPGMRAWPASSQPISRHLRSATDAILNRGGGKRVPPEKFRVALVQMSCGPEPERESGKGPRPRRRRRADRARRSSACPELFQTQYFCQREDHSLFDLAEPIPGPTTEKLAAAAQSKTASS